MSKKSSNFVAIMDFSEFKHNKCGEKAVKMQHLLKIKPGTFGKIFLGIFFVMVSNTIQAQEKVMVIADPHVLANSLVEVGTAMDDMMANQRKMIDFSEATFVALVDTALTHKPTLLLIPGDLTKDGELASHDIVVEQLSRLQEAGIKTLVIPGNHDIGGKAYAYRGSEKISVESLNDSQWESQYAMVYEQALAKDPNSHSYMAEPLHGVTILGIDASHNDGEGYLSDETLAWVLKQADDANEKGNMILAMCHWQLLEHVDNGGVMLESGRLLHADAVRDSLMAHHVHLVLTGHMHVNSISTYRDTLTFSGDSIVEISTGAPITYPCPYRWLTISADRSQLEVRTENVEALPTIADLTNYSREWMREHIQVVIPGLAIRMFDDAEMVVHNYVAGMLGDGIATMLLQQCMPKTDAEKLALVEKYLTPTIIELYLLHSDANEPKYAVADSLAQALYMGMGEMMHEMTDIVLASYATIQQAMIDMVIQSKTAEIQSLVEDRTNWTSKFYSDVTDDLQGVLLINEPQQMTGLEDLRTDETMAIYDILGRRVQLDNALQRGVYIQNGKKIMMK